MLNYMSSLLLADSMSNYLQIFSGTVTLKDASPIQCNLITRQETSVETRAEHHMISNLWPPKQSPEAPPFGKEDPFWGCLAFGPTL